MSDIVNAAVADDLEASDGPGGHLQERVTDALWNELDALVSERLGALSLDDLLRRATAAGLRRPAMEPITFAI